MSCVRVGLKRPPLVEIEVRGTTLAGGTANATTFVQLEWAEAQDLALVLLCALGGFDGLDTVQTQTLRASFARAMTARGGR
jgi:hypothetical protein